MTKTEKADVEGQLMGRPKKDKGSGGKRGPGRPPKDPDLWKPLNVPVEQLLQAVLRPPKGK